MLQFPKGSHCVSTVSSPSYITVIPSTTTIKAGGKMSSPPPSLMSVHELPYVI